MTTEDNLQAGLAAKVATEMEPLIERCSALRTALANHEQIARRDCERRVRNSVFAVLGMPEVPEDPTTAEAKAQLAEQLVSFARFMGVELTATPSAPANVSHAVCTCEGGPPLGARNGRWVHQETCSVRSAPAPIVEPPPSSTPVIASTPPSKRPERVARREDVEAAWKLVEEIDALRTEVPANKHPPARLRHLLQAITAEIRFFEERLPEHHPASERLMTFLPVIGALKAQGGVSSFIEGLAFGATGDWQHIAKRARRKVADFDRDAEDGLRQRPSKGPVTTSLGEALMKAKKVPSNGAPPSSSHSWPKLPLLRAIQGPLLLAGGMLVPEKITSIKERFGLDVEWHVIDHDSPRGENTLERRVRGGKVGAIVLLEGVMRHTTWKSVVDACDSAGVPYAMGDKAGTASLEAAFNELERKLGGTPQEKK